MRALRMKPQIASALEAAALAHELPVRVLAGELFKLKRRQLELLKWSLVEAVSVTPSGDAGSSKRRRLDAYFTPPPVAAAVTARIAELAPNARAILEPSAGLGAFVHAALGTWRSSAAITAVDIRVRKPLRVLQPRVGVVHLDFLRYDVKGYDLILGNPPFSEAEAHVRHALELLEPGGHLGFILRAGFAGGVERARGLWAEDQLRHFATIAPRPSFLRTGNDQTEYALFVWQRGFRGKAVHGKPIDWKAPASSPPPEAAGEPRCEHPKCGHRQRVHADSPEGQHRGACALCKYDWSRCSGFRSAALRGAA